MNRARALLRDRRGVAAVEFALILPLLLGLIAAVIEYGRVLMVEQAVRDIIDSSARSAALTHQSADDAGAQVADAVALVPGIAAYDVSTSDGTALVISVTGSFDLAFGQLLPQQVQTFSLSTTFPR